MKASIFIIVLSIIQLFSETPNHYIREWNKNIGYTGGDIIILNGKYYLADYWNKGSKPTTNDTIYTKSVINDTVWYQIKKMYDYHNNWNDTTVYNLGDIIMYNGTRYIARHYTKGHLPQFNYDYGVWVPLVFQIDQILPPDPGKEGKKTLLGIDSDKDGIRDDIQREIAFHFPFDPHKRAAMLQIAKGKQQELSTYLEQKSQGKKLDELRIDPVYVDMAVEHASNTGAFHIMPVDHLIFLITNTQKRFLAIHEIDATFDGTVFGNYPDEMVCDSTILKLEIKKQEQLK